MLHFGVGSIRYAIQGSELSVCGTSSQYCIFVMYSWGSLPIIRFIGSFFRYALMRKNITQSWSHLRVHFTNIELECCTIVSFYNLQLRTVPTQRKIVSVCRTGVRVSLGTLRNVFCAQNTSKTFLPSFCSVPAGGDSRCFKCCCCGSLCPEQSSH